MTPTDHPSAAAPLDREAAARGARRGFYTADELTEAPAARPDAASRVRESRRPAETDASRGDGNDGKPLELAAVVASLVRPTVAEVLVETRDPRDGTLLLDRRQVGVRPLLAELRDEVVPGGESGGAGRGGGVPLSVDVADVLRDLELLAGGALVQLGLRRRNRYVPHVDPISDALAQLVPARWPTADEVPARYTRQGFTDELAALVARGRAVLDGNAGSTYVRDTRCPVCHAEWVTDKAPGGYDRHPALRVNRAQPEPDGTPGPVRGTSCTSCHRRWSWEEMQGPTATEPAGALWELLAADAEVVETVRRQREEAGRAAELAARARYAGDGPPVMGLPRQAPAGRNRPADRPMPPAPELPVRDDTAAIRAAMLRVRTVD